MTGIVLRRLAHNVRVLELNESAIREDRGAGISCGPDAQDFFKKFDLTGEPYYVPSLGIDILDPESKVKRHLKYPLSNSTWNTLYYRLRANFDGFQSEVCSNPPSLPKDQGEGVIQMGAKAINITHSSGEVVVEYEDMSNGAVNSIKADLIIAADGASSTIRQILLPEIKRIYAGYFSWRGIVPETEMSEQAREMLKTNFNAFAYPGGYILW